MTISPSEGLFALVFQAPLASWLHICSRLFFKISPVFSKSDPFFPLQARLPQADGWDAPKHSLTPAMHPLCGPNFKVLAGVSKVTFLRCGSYVILALLLVLWGAPLFGLVFVVFCMFWAVLGCWLAFFALCCFSLFPVFFQKADPKMLCEGGLAAMDSK